MLQSGCKSGANRLSRLLNLKYDRRRIEAQRVTRVKISLLSKGSNSQLATATRFVALTNWLVGEASAMPCAVALDTRRAA